MKRINLSHYAVMMKTVAALRSGRGSSVIPKYIITMSNGVKVMCNKHAEGLYIQLENGYVEPMNLLGDVAVDSVYTIRSRKVAFRLLKEWYDRA